MLNKAAIGKSFPPVIAEVEKGRLRFFAKAIGEANPIYTCELAAKSAGYPSLPLAPTFLFSLKMDVPEPFGNYESIGVSLSKVLHANQAFAYHQDVIAGDTLRFDSEVTDIYDKRNGLLEFLVEKTKVSNQHGDHVADLTTTLVVRN
ncbi:MaoC family dehydratase N-terminal domain-containing protein [Thalassotalea psychrophila]|uniref:MaoC family dehydratase N-terminal domain-containing protein n=1 Tax=Thalassotalea psychrophila TaxID=3065647 RepID=A0ABY9TZ78_9GAMM|nr:MaoC family dehydratase N-terminal domain-containing protein [Colwelliaceae bacterium SQ149]